MRVMRDTDFFHSLCADSSSEEAHFSSEEIFVKLPLTINRRTGAARPERRRQPADERDDGDVGRVRAEAARAAQLRGTARLLQYHAQNPQPAAAALARRLQEQRPVGFFLNFCLFLFFSLFVDTTVGAAAVLLRYLKWFARKAVQ